MSRDKSQKGKLGANKLAAIAFEKRYGEMNALFWHTGRGSTDDKRVLLLPSGTIRKEVYDEFFDLWNHLIDSALELEQCSDSRPEKPLA